MTLRGIFVGADGRLRAPWRIFVFLIVTALCLQLIALTKDPLFGGLERLVGIEGTSDSMVVVLALLASHAIMLRGIDKRDWQAVGLDSEAARPALFARGWLLGALPILLPSVALLGAGWLAVRPGLHGSWWLAAAQLSFFLLPAAFYEELFSRGYLFATLREWLGWPAALALTSLGFGLLHLANPGANAGSVIMVSLAGVFLGVILLVTGSLFAAWMAHWAWNWVMAVVLHAAVSGVAMPRPEYQTVDAGPDWITGGPWGPEGGAGAAVGMLAAMAYLYMKRPRGLSWRGWITSSTSAHDER